MLMTRKRNRTALRGEPGPSRCCKKLAPSRNASHLAATCRVADVDRVAQVEVVSQGREVGNPVVHVLAGAGLVVRPWPRRSWAITR
jgi:hypothetical protein